MDIHDLGIIPAKEKPRWMLEPIIPYSMKLFKCN